MQRATVDLPWLNATLRFEGTKDERNKQRIELFFAQGEEQTLKFLRSKQEDKEETWRQLETLYRHAFMRGVLKWASPHVKDNVVTALIEKEKWSKGRNFLLIAAYDELAHAIHAVLIAYLYMYVATDTDDPVTEFVVFEMINEGVSKRNANTEEFAYTFEKYNILRKVADAIATRLVVNVDAPAELLVASYTPVVTMLIKLLDSPRRRANVQVRIANLNTPMDYLIKSEKAVHAALPKAALIRDAILTAKTYMKYPSATQLDAFDALLKEIAQ